jgi:di/tricarboxylate transporter
VQLVNWMPSDTTTVFCLIGIAAVLMASNRVRFDLVALLVVVALILSGVLSVEAALSGFGSPVVVMIAGLLIIGEMLDRTGVARAVGDWILARGGKSEAQLLLLIMFSAGILGSVMSSTAIVAIFIPIVLRIAGETGISRSRILIPMSYAALISGMMTLIASPPNLVVVGELVSAGYDGLGLFSFSLIGLAVLGVAVLYILLLGRHLLPGDPEQTPAVGRQRTLTELWLAYRVDDEYDAVEITPQSPLVGTRIADTGLYANYGIRALARVRRDRRGRDDISLVSGDLKLQTGDILLISGGGEQQERLISEGKLRRFAGYAKSVQRWMWEIGMAEVLVHPDSRLIGSSVTESEFRTRYGLQVIGLRRAGAAIGDVEHDKLESGDSLLLYGPWSKIEHLNSHNHDFVVTHVPSEHSDVVPEYRKAPIALVIVGAMVLLSVLDVLPLLVAVLLAAIAAIMTGCLSAEHAYRSIHWSSLVLVAGMLPLADALEYTGGSAMIADGLFDMFGDAGPRAMLAIIFALTAVLGLVLSNTASAVLIAPIAIETAEAMQISPYPFAIAVLIAASAAFSTPVSTPVVTLVVEPGRYSFMDFIKVGVPLLLLTGMVTVLLTPLLFPFQGP